MFGPSELLQINAAVRAGRGAAASVLGQSYDVYRLTSSTSNAIVTGTPLITNFQAIPERTTDKKQIENQVFDLLVFELTCDDRNLQVLDVLVETGYGAQPDGVYTIVSKRPLRATLAIRTEFTAFVSRMNPAGGAAIQQPTSGAIVAPGYVGTTKASEQIATLTNGMFSFSAAIGSEAAQINVGLQPIRRVRDGSSLKVPTALYREDFLLWAPLMPGEILQELDRINLGNSDRYEVASIYSSDLTGIAGYIAIGEKLSN